MNMMKIKRCRECGEEYLFLAQWPIRRPNPGACPRCACKRLKKNQPKEIEK